MDVNELTADELRKLADEKSLEAERVIDVDGLTVTVNPERCKSWKAFRIMSSVSGEFNLDTLAAMFDLVELVTDVNEQIIVEHCGGDDASLEAVAGTVSKIVAECYPKN